MSEELIIRECVSLDELEECVSLQRDVFELPEVELSPVRHLVVTKNAGGFTLGAYSGDRLAGFVLSVPAFMRGEPAYYSHMTGVRPEFQSLGIGAKLKWAQREEAISRGVRFIKWTFEPLKARNAYFNLEKLGAVISEIQENFYGTDYGSGPTYDPDHVGLASDRLFAEWHLESEKVATLARGERYETEDQPASAITITNDWNALMESDRTKALVEQLRVRREFHEAFAAGFVCRSFHRDAERPAYLLYRS